MKKRNHKGKNNPFYGKTHTEESKKKQSIAQLGNRHPSWKGGHSYTYNRKFYIPLVKTLKQCCCLCGNIKNLLTHHIDGNYEHNELDNISIVCKKCHYKVHKTIAKKLKKEKKWR